jgi:hypothetical protein
MSIKVGNKYASVEVSDELENMIKRVVSESAPTIIDRLEEVTTELREQAVPDWPVGRERGRPHSKDLFESGVRLSGRTSIEGYVSNDAGYSWYIKPKSGPHAGKSVFTTLIRRPGRKAGKQLAADLASDIKKLAGGK